MPMGRETAVIAQLQLVTAEKCQDARLEQKFGDHDKCERHSTMHIDLVHPSIVYQTSTKVMFVFVMYHLVRCKGDASSQYHASLSFVDATEDPPYHHINFQDPAKHKCGGSLPGPRSLQLRSTNPRQPIQNTVLTLHHARLPHSFCNNKILVVIIAKFRDPVSTSEAARFLRKATTNRPVGAS